jgi:hypothetical protein
MSAEGGMPPSPMPRICCSRRRSSLLNSEATAVGGSLARAPGRSRRVPADRRAPPARRPARGRRPGAPPPSGLDPVTNARSSGRVQPTPLRRARSRSRRALTGLLAGARLDPPHERPVDPDASAIADLVSAASSRCSRMALPIACLRSRSLVLISLLSPELPIARPQLSGLGPGRCGRACQSTRRVFAEAYRL